MTLSKTLYHSKPVLFHQTKFRYTNALIK